jgi:prephenate dehydrogenase
MSRAAPFSAAPSASPAPASAPTPRAAALGAPDIGMIGTGRFGEYFARQLERVGHHVHRYDPAIPEIAGRAARARACGARLAIYAVPIRNLEAALLETRSELGPATVVMDVCSVKMIPCDLLTTHLPPHIAGVGTHPVFGPHSAPVSCASQRLALCAPPRRAGPADIAALAFARSILATLGVSIIECTPEEHDRQMARSQFLTHFIGRGAERCGIERVALSTRTHDALMDIVDIVTQDTWTLFEDMAAFNPMAAAARAEFLAALQGIDGELAARESALI